MKVGVFLILVILGSLCSALQPGLEYHYRYSGRVATGITDIKNQFAAAGIEADVTIEVAEDYTAIFQFSHIQVGDFHDEVTCDVRAPLPIEYHDLEYGVELLQTPFRVKIDNTKKGLVFEYLEVPQEPVWITNIRKSVVNIFRITPFGPESSVEEVSPDALHHLDFSSKDETIAGRCTNWYGIVKLPEVEATIFDREHEIEDDVQSEGTGESGSQSSTKGRKGAKGVSKSSKTSRTSSKTSKSRYSSPVPKVNDIIWSVTRTTDFESCDYLSFGKLNINKQTEDLITRSSVSTYIIRGDTEGMRIEKAFVEGSITVFGQEDHREHYDTLTNQTLNLKAVRATDGHLTIDYEVRHLTSFSFTGDSRTLAAEAKNGASPLEQVLTGIELTPSAIEEIKLNVITSIENIVGRKEESTHAHTLVEEISHVAEDISLLGYDELQELLIKFVSETISFIDPNPKLEVFFHGVIASGSKAAIKLMLELVPQYDFQRSHSRFFHLFFSTLSHTVKNPSLIPEIMDAVKLIVPHGDDKLSGHMTLPLTYFSDLLGNVCFGSTKRSAYWMNTCEKPFVCDSEAIASVYIPYLRDKLQDESAPLWQRYLFLKAVVNLRTPLVLDILKPYILGSKDYHLAFRKTAIFALSKPYMPVTATAEVMNWLMSIFENVEEDHEVRSIAFLVMATREIDVSWWNRMAVATWREPSNRLANFISTTIRTTARLKDEGKLTQIARQVEHLTKPPTPATISQSANYYLLDFLHTSKNDRFVSFAWLADGETFLPSDLYVRLSIDTFFGYSREVLVNLDTQYIDFVLKRALWYIGTDPSKLNQDALDIVKGMYEEVKEKLGYEQFFEMPHDSILIKLQKEVALAVSSGRGDGYARSSVLDFFFLEMRYGAQYNRIREAYAVMPTDLGLPFAAVHTIESASWVHDFGEGRSFTESFEASKRFVFEVKTFVPWSQKFAIGTRTEKLGSLSIPLFNLTLFSNDRKVSFEVVSTTKDDILEAHNIPATVQYGAFPTTIHEDTREYKVIHKKEKCIYDDKLQLSPSTEFSWKGDARNPLSLKNILSGDFTYFLRTQKYWEAHIAYNPEQATTKGITIQFTYVSTDKTARIEEVEGEMGTGQGSIDYGDYSQVSQSSGGFDYSQFSQSSGGQEFGEVDFIEQQQSSSTIARIAKLQDQVVPAAGGHVRSISFDIGLFGSVDKSYAALFTWASGASSSSKRQTKFQFTWIEEVPIGTLGEPHSTCLDFKIEKPVFHHFQSPEVALGTNFHSTFSIDLHQGTDCSAPALFELEGTMDVTEGQMAEARRKLTEPNCEGHPELRPFELITSQLYDHITFKAHWPEILPIGVKNFTYHLYDIIRGVRFPDAQFDYTVTNPSNQVTLDAAKCLETEKWTLHVTKPHETTIVENVRFPYLLNVIASPAPARNTLIFDRLAGRKREPCVLTHESVRTFDGVVYPYEPSECWNVLAFDTSGYGLGSIEARLHDGQWEVRIIFPTEAILFELTHSEFRVNGEEYTGNDHRFDVYHESDGNLLVLNLFTDAAIKVKEDAIYFMEDKIMRGLVHGICGNMNGETTNEMVGPKGCVYTDPDLFVKSWTIPGEGCSGFTYLAKKKPVQAYQDVCPHAVTRPTGVAYPEILEDHCTTWTYKEIEVEGRHCRSTDPVPVCGSGCHPTHNTKAKIQYDCELTEGSSDTGPKCILEELYTEVQLFCVRN